MSITPPTDIVLDVARAADPTRYSAAAARLSRPAAPGDDFAALLKTTDAVAANADHATTEPATAGKGDAGGRAGKAYQSFEAMTLATMIESAMPDDASSYFGAGTAGSVWKSMLADQIAQQMAAAGGVGIATQLAKSSQAALVADGGQISPGNAVKSMLIDTVQRGFLGGLTGANDNDDSAI